MIADILLEFFFNLSIRNRFFFFPF